MACETTSLLVVVRFAVFVEPLSSTVVNIFHLPSAEKAQMQTQNRLATNHLDTAITAKWKECRRSPPTYELHTQMK